MSSPPDTNGIAAVWNCSEDLARGTTGEQKGGGRFPAAQFP